VSFESGRCQVGMKPCGDWHNSVWKIKRRRQRPYKSETYFQIIKLSEKTVTITTAPKEIPGWATCRTSFPVCLIEFLSEIFLFISTFWTVFNRFESRKCLKCRYFLTLIPLEVRAGSSLDFPVARFFFPDTFFSSPLFAFPPFPLFFSSCSGA